MAYRTFVTMIFGKHRRKGMRRQDSKARVHAWRNVLVATNILVILCAAAYLPLRHSGLLESWFSRHAAPPIAFPASDLSLPSAGKKRVTSASVEARSGLLPMTPEAGEPKKEAAATEELIVSATVALEEGSLDTATRLLDEALAAAVLDRERADAWNLKGRVLSMRHLESEAVAAHLSAMSFWPTAPDSYILASDCLRRLGHPGAALELLREGTTQCGSSPLFNIKINLARIEMGEIDQVTEEIRRMITDGELPVHQAFVQAVILHRTGERETAQRLVETIRRQASPAEWKVFMSDPAVPAAWSHLSGSIR